MNKLGKFQRSIMHLLREDDYIGLTTENSPTPSAEKSPTWLPVFARRERISAE